MSESYLVKKAPLLEMVSKVITDIDKLTIISSEGGIHEVEWVWASTCRVYTNTSWVLVTEANQDLCKLEVFKEIR